MNNRRTDGRDGDPSQDLGQDRVDVGQVWPVGHRRQPVAAHGVELCLRALHDIRVLRHGEQESERR